MSGLKNLMQLGGIGCIVWAVYSAWEGLPVRDAIINGLATFTTTQGPSGHEQIVSLARSMPERLVTSPWLLAGVALVLIPYLATIAARAFTVTGSPVRR